MAKSKYKTRITKGIKYFYDQFEEGYQANGKRKRKTITARTEEELEEKIQQYKEAIRAGNTDNINKTIAPIFDTWFKVEKLKGIKATSANRYTQLYNNYLKDSSLLKKRINKIKAMDITVFYKELQEGGASKSTLKLLHIIIKPFMQHLYEEGYTNRVYCPNFSRACPEYAPKPKKINVLTKDEQSRLINALEGSSYRVLILFALATGLRIGELTALTWKDIVSGKVSVNKTHNKAAGEKGKRIDVITPPKSDKSVRTLIMPSFLIEELKQHEKLQKEMKLLKGLKWVKNNLVFSTFDGKYYCHNVLNFELKKLLVKAGIDKDKTFHCLRKSFCTRLFEKGVPIKTVSALCGHTKEKTTSDIYIEVMGDLKEEVAEVLNDIFAV